MVVEGESNSTCNTHTISLCGVMSDVQIGLRPTGHQPPSKVRAAITLSRNLCRHNDFHLLFSYSYSCLDLGRTLFDNLMSDTWEPENSYRKKHSQRGSEGHCWAPATAGGRCCWRCTGRLQQPPNRRPGSREPGRAQAARTGAKALLPPPGWPL